MRALLLVHNMEHRGSWFRAHEIAKRLARNGHEVHFVFVGEHKGKYRGWIWEAEAVGAGTLTKVESPWRTFLNERQEGWGVLDVDFRLWYAMRGRWDLVYAFSHKPNCILPALAAKARGAKAVMDWSDWWGGEEGLFRTCVLPSDYFQALPMPLKAARRAIFAVESAYEPRAPGWMDAVSLISQEYLGHPRAPRGLKEKSYVMHSGAPLEQIVPMDKRAARAELGLPQDRVILGYLANFHTDEQLLLQALARVAEAHPGVLLVAVGTDFEKEDEALHERVKAHLRHLGRQPFERVGVHLAAADMLLLPLTDVALNRARYPHKLSDYVASGRPIVACDVGETGRLLRRFDFGKLTAPTAEGFAAGIAELIDEWRRWEEMEALTRQVAEEQFSWDVLAEGLFQFLEQKTGLRFRSHAKKISPGNVR